MYSCLFFALFVPFCGYSFSYVEHVKYLRALKLTYLPTIMRWRGLDEPPVLYDLAGCLRQLLTEQICQRETK